MRKIFYNLVIVLCMVMVLSTNVFAVTTKSEELDQIQQVIDLINESYKDDVAKDKLIQGAIKGMLNELDPYSAYYTKQEYQDMINSLNGEYFGIGVYIKKVNRLIEVTGVIKNSPAEKVGIKIGDKFYSVDGKTAVDMDSDTFVSKVRGKKGTSVKLEVIRESASKPIEFNVARDSIVIEPVEYKIIEDNIGYIKINEFGENMDRKVGDALKYFDSKKVDKIVIDLRGNPGGYLTEAIALGKRFIPKGPIVHIKQKNEPKQTYNSNLISPKYKLAVLVDGGSASASEIFAGAVKDTKAGKVIGTKTYGKGTVQTFFKLGTNAYVKLTIANYLTPKETSVDGVGLTPDFVVENKKDVDTSKFEKLSYFRNIYGSNKGKDVLAVEQRLEVLGYNVDGPDYTYDSLTQKEVIRFKKEHKLLASSVITKDVIAALEKDINDAVTKDAQLDKAIEVLSH